MVLYEIKIEENKILYSYRFISFTLSLRNIISILPNPDRKNYTKLTRNSNFIVVTNSNNFYEKSSFCFSTDSSIETNPLQHHITP